MVKLLVMVSLVVVNCIFEEEFIVVVELEEFIFKSICF